MNIVFMGTPDFSVPILKAVQKKYKISLVVTQPDRPFGRKRQMKAPPVKVAAKELGIRVVQPRRIQREYKEILKEKPDIIITAAYGQMIPDEIIDYPKLGCINVHGSLLPKLRGGAPIQRAIMRGYKKTGITIMYMTYKMDEGDIIAQRSIPIQEDDTTGTLFKKLSYLGKELLMDTLPDIINETNSRQIQDENKATYAYNLKRAEEQVDWNMTMKEIDRHLRAFSPKPKLYTIIDKKRLKIHALSLHDCSGFQAHHSHQENGTIVKLFPDAIGVKCKDGVVLLKVVQLAGKTKQDVKTFMNGAGRNLIEVDKQFESR